MTQEKPPADDCLFETAMRQVKPLKQDKITPVKPNLSPQPRPRQRNQTPTGHDHLSDGYEPQNLSTEEGLIFVRSGIQHRILRRLQRGHYNIEDSLDLHGLIATEARAAVASFMHNCEKYNLRCVRIIHGKGYRSSNQTPILKNKINHWLPQYSTVLAFCSAPIHDGGTGAIYVLLKRQRQF